MYFSLFKINFKERVVKFFFFNCMINNNRQSVNMGPYGKRRGGGVPRGTVQYPPPNTRVFLWWFSRFIKTLETQVSDLIEGELTFAKETVMKEILKAREACESFSTTY